MSKNVPVIQIAFYKYRKDSLRSETKKKRDDLNNTKASNVHEIYEFQMI
jgi:hypothetical protein